MREGGGQMLLQILEDRDMEKNYTFSFTFF
jgi:hypothetical protein